MTTPEQNEPEHLEAEGYLNRALRRLGEGLGPFVYGKIQDKELLIDEEKSIVTRDLSVIFGKMEQNWTRLGLSYDEWNYMGLLIGFRNGPWAHLAGYSDNDVFQRLGEISRLLKAVSAEEQARTVEQIYAELGKLLFSRSEPELQRDSEIAELRQQLFAMQIQLSRISGQSELSRFSTSSISRDPFVSDVAPNEKPPDLGASALAIPDMTKIAEQASGFVAKGTANYHKGEYDSAIANFSKSLQLDPRRVDAYVLRGIAYAEQGDYDRAIADYESVLRLAPDFADAYILRGIAYQEKGEHDLAIVDFDIGLQLTPEEAEAYYHRGISYAEKGEYDQAIADYEATLQINPDHAIAFHNRGLAYFDKGDYDRAIADFDEALRLNPDYESAYGNRGNAYYEKREYDRAIADYGAAMQFSPDFSYAYNKRGLAYTCIGEFARAIADFDEALRLNPDYPGAYNNRGLAYVLIGEYDQAIADIESAIALYSDDEMSKRAYDLKELAIRLRDKTTEYDRHIQENPDDPHGWHLRGIYHLDSGDEDRAIADFSRAISLAPGDAAVWNDRGLAWWQKGEIDQSCEDFSQAIALKPDLANAYYNRAWVWRRRGEHGNAIIDFSQAIALNPDYAAAYEHRGQSYFFVDKPELGQADRYKARDLGFGP